jgi:hypothetical protein
MAIEQQKAVPTAQMENSPVSDDRLRLAAHIAECLRDAGFDCEVAAPLSVH